MAAVMDMPTDPRRDPALTARGTPRRRAARARLAVAITPEMLADAPAFEPARTRSSRHDGWTYPRQRAFVAALARTCCVARAAEIVGMSAVGAYRLKRQPGNEGFARAWDEALTIVGETLSDLALDRAIHGVAVPIYWQGEQVGERRCYDNRLLALLLRAHDPGRYGGPIRDRVPAALREALYEEWARERAEAERRDEGDMHDRFIDTLEMMRQRLQAAGELPPDYEETTKGESQMTRYVILSDHFYRLRRKEEAEEQK